MSAGGIEGVEAEGVKDAEGDPSIGERRKNPEQTRSSLSYQSYPTQSWLAEDYTATVLRARIQIRVEVLCPLLLWYLVRERELKHSS